MAPRLVLEEARANVLSNGLFPQHAVEQALPRLARELRAMAPLLSDLLPPHSYVLERLPNDESGAPR